MKFGDIVMKKSDYETLDELDAKVGKVIRLLLTKIYKEAALQNCTLYGTNKGGIPVEKWNRVRLAPAGIKGIYGECVQNVLILVISQKIHIFSYCK
jgi:hypothetical protein